MLKGKLSTAEPKYVCNCYSVNNNNGRGHQLTPETTALKDRNVANTLHHLKNGLVVWVDLTHNLKFEKFHIFVFGSWNNGG